MTEDELREIARTAKILLSIIVPAADVARLNSELDQALALPLGEAQSALTRVLTSHPDLKRWVREDARPGLGISPRTDQYRSLKATRHLIADLPDQVVTGVRFSVLVKVGLEAAPGLVDSGFQMDIPEEGVTVTVHLSAHGFAAEGDQTRYLAVPQKADSDWAEFILKAARPGRFPISVRVFSDGTPVAELEAEVTVAEKVQPAAQQAAPRAVAIDDLAAEPGEVTLQVEEVQGQLRFRLFSYQRDPLDASELIANKPATIVSELAKELGLLAAGKSEYRGASRLTNLRSTGISLWSQAVPEAIARQFWQLHSEISTFSVLSDSELPWELMYPLSSRDEGFLVEQFPVLRRVGGQSRTRHLGLASADFVVPRTSPKTAAKEVQMLRTRLGEAVTTRVIDDFEILNARMRTPPSLVHFSCHNIFSEETGSRIGLVGGPFRPVNLAEAVQRTTLKDSATLVFMNACRTAGQVKGLTRPLTWAQGFIAAGAGAFVGTLWDVRSEAAADFADSFYEGLVTKRLPLGKAALEARRTAKARTNDGDPTWLAYTVYGSPSAAVKTALPRT